MLRIGIAPVLVLVLLGCSGSPKKPKDPQDAQREAAAAERKKLDAERPQRPFETRERLAYRPVDRCGQGPYRIELESLRASYGEQVVVYACGPREISGSYRFTVQRKAQVADASDSAFGFGRDNEACKAGRAQVVVATPGSSTGGGGGGGGPGGAAGKPTAPPATMTPMRLERVAGVPEQCRSRSSVVDTTYTASAGWIPLDAHLAVDIWSEEPNDFEGVVFVVEKRAVVADMTDERWKAYQEADRAWYARYRAFLDGEVTAGRTTLLDMKVKTPPPPPPRAEAQPPRPSRNARWIPGYWHYADTSFHWIAGLWQVPDEDVAKDLTVHAPAPPPAVRAEQPEPQPVATAVWASGQWQWDGRAWVWIAGAWRIPPSAQHAWRPAAWSIGARGAVFVPGGWHVRIRR